MNGYAPPYITLPAGSRPIPGQAPAGPSTTQSVGGMLAGLEQSSTPYTGAPAGNILAVEAPRAYAPTTRGSHAPVVDPGPPIKTRDVDRGPEGCNLFIFHVPNDLTNIALYNLFAPFGPVLSARIMVDKRTGCSRGFGFVSYDNAESAANAIKCMNGFQLGHKRLKVELKKEKAARGSADPRGYGGLPPGAVIDPQYVTAANIAQPYAAQAGGVEVLPQQVLQYQTAGAAAVPRAVGADGGVQQMPGVAYLRSHSGGAARSGRSPALDAGVDDYEMRYKQQQQQAAAQQQLHAAPTKFISSLSALNGLDGDGLWQTAPKDGAEQQPAQLHAQLPHNLVSFDGAAAAAPVGSLSAGLAPSLLDVSGTPATVTSATASGMQQTYISLASLPPQYASAIMAQAQAQAQQQAAAQKQATAAAAAPAAADAPRAAAAPAAPAAARSRRPPHESAGSAGAATAPPEAGKDAGDGGEAAAVDAAASGADAVGGLMNAGSIYAGIGGEESAGVSSIRSIWSSSGSIGGVDASKGAEKEENPVDLSKLVESSLRL